MRLNVNIRVRDDEKTTFIVENASRSIIVVCLSIDA